jgi:polyhydroxyalkanoate synthase
LQARLTGGLSPVALSLAWLDWCAHLAGRPGRQAELADAWRAAARLSAGAWPGSLGPVPAGGQQPDDPRFAAPGWRDWPLRVPADAFGAVERWWQEAASGVPGVSPHHERVAAFGARQLLARASPSNLPWLNPEVIEATIRRRGANLARGARLRAGDWQRLVTGSRPAGTEAFTLARRSRSPRARWSSAAT